MENCVKDIKKMAIFDLLIYSYGKIGNVSIPED